MRGEEVRVHTASYVGHGPQMVLEPDQCEVLESG